MKCAYNDPRCEGRVFGKGVGSRQHLSCPKGYAAYLAAQPKSWTAKVKAEKAAREAFEARKAARVQAKAAEPVKPVKVSPDKAQVLAALATIAEWVKAS